jgi:hypothetical protein
MCGSFLDDRLCSFHCGSTPPVLRFSASRNNLFFGEKGTDRREQAHDVDHVWQRYDRLPVSMIDINLSIHTPPESEEL